MSILDNEEVLSFYAYVFFTIMLTLATLFLPFLLYTVYTKSTKEMGPFKLFLLSEIFWCYAFGFILGIIHPIIYFPYVIVRFSGPLNILCTKNGCFFIAELFFFVAVGYAQSLFCVVLFRLWRMSPLGYRYNSTYQQRFIILFFALTIPSIIFVTPIVLAKVDVEQTLDFLIQRDSGLAFLKNFKDQLVVYHNPANNDFWITFLAALIGITMILITIGSVVVMSLLTYYTYYYKSKMSNERFKMSIMLLKVMILQVFFAIFLLVLPMSCAILFVMSDSKYSTIAVLISGIVASTHSLTEFICIAYTIKPYREAFHTIFTNFINLFSRNEFQAQMRPISYSVTSRNSLF